MERVKYIVLVLVLMAVRPGVCFSQTYVNRLWEWDPDSGWTYEIVDVGYDTLAVWDVEGWRNGPYPGGLPYIVEADINVYQTGTLQILPGVWIALTNNGSFHVLYGGSLNAIGKEDSLISFSYILLDDPDYWKSIELISSYGIFKWCVFEYGGGGYGPTIKVAESSWLEIENCTFQYNNCGDSAVIDLDSCIGMQMVNTQIGDNSGGAILLRYSMDAINILSSVFTLNTYGINVQDGQLNVNYSDFRNNQLYGIQNSSYFSVDARYCFWGDTSGPSGDAPGEGDAVYGNVIYEPWVGASNSPGAAQVSSSEILGPNNQYTDSENALGAPDGDWVSLGVNGYIILDMGGMIEDSPGPEFTIFESDNEGKNSRSIGREGFFMAVGEDTASWSPMVRGSGTETFDVGTVRIQRFRYIKIVDDGDGDSLASSPGYDLDAVYTQYPLPMPRIWVLDSIPPYTDKVIDFGDIPQGDTARTQVVVCNLGSEALLLSEIFLANGENFFLESVPSLPENIYYGSPVVFTVGFISEPDSIFTDELLIISDDFWEDTVTINLLGTGLPSYITDKSSHGEGGITFLRLLGPVPFQKETRIQFGLKEESWVKLEIYNSCGQKINVLLDSPCNYGLYTVKWTGKDSFGRRVAKGVYFVRMQTKEFATCRTIIKE